MNQIHARANRSNEPQTLHRMSNRQARSGKEMTKALFDIQNEMLDRLLDMQRSWGASAKRGASLSSEIFMAATAAHRDADASDAYRQRMQTQLDIIEESAKRLLSLGENLASISARSMNGSREGGTRTNREESSNTVRRAEAA